MCRIDFLLRFGFCSFFLNSDSVRNEFGSVRFKKTRFGSDIIVIYYSCDDCVVNLLQILHDVTHDNDNK